jgi:hypothetical protein
MIYLCICWIMKCFNRHWCTVQTWRFVTVRSKCCQIPPPTSQHFASRMRRSRVVRLSWYSHHVRIYGNELADHLAKAAACNTETAVSFERIPKSTLYSEIEEEATQKWQKEWENCTKAAISKQFFPNVRDRIKLNTVIPRLTKIIRSRITFVSRNLC